MTLQTDLSRSPYFDDYDSTKNFYRVLYRPSVALQTRELNQMQTIMQDQIDKFGRHIFKEGSVIEGCSFTFDPTYNYVKIQDNYANGTAFTITDFSNNYITNSNGLKALIINTEVGYESQDPDLNSLFLKYLNTGTFPNGAPQSTFANAEILRIATTANVAIGNVTVATVANSTGIGYAFTTTSGVIFQKGFFVAVSPQTIIVEKYTNLPNNLSIGFDTVENIVTPEADTTLYDNAAGSPNYSAPGAHRLQLVPTLVKRLTTDVANTTSFFSLCDFKEGKPVSIKNNPQYALIGAEMARRTFETNGDYVVSPFILSTETKPTTDPKYTTHFNLLSSRGMGYVKGYRVEYINNNKVAVRKGNDYETIAGQVVSTNYGYYIGVKEFVGEFNSYDLIKVELHNTAKTAITSGLGLTTSYTSGTKIGTAFVRGFSYDSGAIGTNDATYNAFLFNIEMLPGKKFYDVKSIINYNSSTVEGIGDVVLTLNAAFNANVATIQQSEYSNMIFPFGQKGIKLNGFDNTEYVYRDKQTASFSTLATGSMTISLPASPHGTATETLDQIGTLSKASINKFIVTPLTTGLTSAKTGTVSTTAGSNVVTGSGTAFITNYMVGDHIRANGETRLITFIANNTSLKTLQNWATSPSSNVHYKAFPAGTPLDLSKSNGIIVRGVTTTNTTATFTLGETLGSSFQAKVYYDILRSATKPMSKQIKRNVYVAINCASVSTNTVGPYSLGLPDVYRINNIYINDSTFANTGVNRAATFKFDNGQRDGYYGLASITPQGATLNTTSRIIVDLDVFTFNRDTGVGFFTANSYPVDDVNGAANTNAILTQDIPEYTGFDGSIYDLRDSVDFRPYAANTASPASNSTNWGVTTPTVNPSAALTFNVLGGYGSYLPTPDSNFQSDIQHYLRRKDRVVISTDGTLSVIEGSANNIPIPPNELPGAMTLGIIDVPPYPSLASREAAAAKRYDYAATVNITQNKRYTMKDVHTLANRIDNLEYYTSLSLLEKSAKETLVRSSVTGQNRFQNGILVDPFKGHDIGNVQDPSYRISIDSEKTELRAAFNQFHRPFKLDTVNSTNVVQKGDAILLTHTSAQYIAQPFASKFRNCIDGNIFVWKGEVNFNPPGDYQPDVTKAPDVVTNLDLASNFTAIASAFGTQWGNWQTTSSATTAATSDNGSSSTTDSKGNITNKTKTQTVTTTTQQQQRAGTQLGVTTATNNYNLGTYVTDVSILPYVRSIATLISVHGLKPNTRVYAFMASADVNAWIRQCAPDFSAGTPTYNTTAGSAQYGDMVSGTKDIGAPLISDSQGRLFAKYLIPPSTFKSTTLEMMFIDADNPVTGADAITTKATGTFYGSNLSTAKGSSILSAREAVVVAQQVIDQQTISQQVIRNDESTVVIPGPPAPVPWYPPYYDGGTYNPYDYSTGGDGGGGGGCGNDGGGTGGTCGGGG